MWYAFILSQVMMVHIFIPITLEAEEGSPLWVLGQSSSRTAKATKRNSVLKKQKQEKKFKNCIHVYNNAWSCLPSIFVFQLLWDSLNCFPSNFMSLDNMTWNWKNNLWCPYTCGCGCKHSNIPNLHVATFLWTTNSFLASMVFYEHPSIHPCRDADWLHLAR